MNSFLKIFLPKDRIFFELFEKIGINVAGIGKKLKEVVYETDFDKRAALISQCEDLEHANDELTHQVYTELSRNFITPFDREDIHSLASALDDIVDYIYSSAKKINFYRVNPNDTGFQKFADLIEQATQQISIAVTELRLMKRVKELTDALIKVNSIENLADEVFDMSVEKLFSMETNAIEIMKKKEIYQVMEIATDKCEMGGNVINNILIKYA